MAALAVRYRQGGTVRWGELQGPAPTSGDDRVVVAPYAIEADRTETLIAAFEADALVTEAPIELAGSDLMSPITDDATLIAKGFAEIAKDAFVGAAQHRW